MGEQEFQRFECVSLFITEFIQKELCVDKDGEQI